MFALEISFSDSNSDPEMIFIRRQQALIGSSEEAHVEVQDMEALDYEVRLIRDLGRKFRVVPVPRSKGVSVPTVLEGTYDEQARLDLGAVKINITALDSDLFLKEGETPDRAGVRVMRQACSTASPLFPALVVFTGVPTVLSFVPDSPVYIGTAKNCGLRIDSQDVSPKHARIGYESGEFWVEDLGSTNGTFVNNNQISGRISVPSGTLITLGKSLGVMGVTSEDQIQRASSYSPAKAEAAHVEERRYPVLISVSEVARPARLLMPIDSVINIGRDPSSDIWLGAPHVSRRHCSFTLSKTGQVAINDHSTNGTSYDDGVLHRGDVVHLKDQARVFDFGGGVTLAVCFNEQQEKNFVASGGDPHVFRAVESEGNDEVALFQARRAPLARPLRSAAVLQQGRKAADFMQRAALLYRSLGVGSKIALYITAVLTLVTGIILINLVLRLNV